VSAARYARHANAPIAPYGIADAVRSLIAVARSLGPIAGVIALVIVVLLLTVLVIGGVIVVVGSLLWLQLTTL
jgi:hypothetical protein